MIPIPGASGWLSLAVSLQIAAALPRATQTDQAADAASPSRIGRMSIWDDGLSEMSYYDAERAMYGKVRKYTRVHMINRQWFDTQRGVKSDDPNSPGVAAVFKFYICEEIPTENYNYRFATMVFLRRDSLRPLKTVESSQEWCGTTYKHLRWTPEGLDYKSFSYLPGEGENEWKLDKDVWPFEAMFILARERVAGGSIGQLQSVLPPLQTNRQTTPNTSETAKLVEHGSATPISLREESAAEDVRVPAGSFKTQQVVLDNGGKTYRFWIETEAPYRLIRFKSDELAFELRGVERRAYWDRGWKSRFYRQGEAP